METDASRHQNNEQRITIENKPLNPPGFTTAFCILVILLLCTVLSKSLYSGAWPQKKGGYYLKLSGNYMWTDNEYNHLGKSVPIFNEHPARENASFRDFNLAVYMEYGLFSRLTLITDLPYKFLKSEWDSFLEFDGPTGREKITIPEEHSNTGFGDLRILGRYAFLTNPLVISLQGGPYIPLYSRDPESSAPQMGTGDLQLEGQLLVGKSFWPSPFYVTGGGGYRYRNGPLNDEILFNFEIGFSKKEYLIKLYFEGIRNTKKPPDLIGAPIQTPIPGGGGAFPDVIVGDKHETKLGPSFFYRFNETISMQFEALHTFHGVNTTNATTFSLALILSK